MDTPLSMDTCNVVEGFIGGLGSGMCDLSKNICQVNHRKFTPQKLTPLNHCPLCRSTHAAPTTDSD